VSFDGHGRLLVVGYAPVARLRVARNGQRGPSGLERLAQEPALADLPTEVKDIL